MVLFACAKEVILGIQTASKKSKKKKEGRDTLIESNEFIHNGVSYPVNYNEARNDSALNAEVLGKFINEICAMQEHYSRVYVLRFDFHAPKNMAIDQSNQLISQFFSKLRDKFKAKNWDNQPIKNFAYGWVWEIETAKQAHYHLWIAVPGNQVRDSGHVEYGMFKILRELWCELTGGMGHSYLPKNSGYMITRTNDSELIAFVSRVSYLAKKRGKYSLGDKTKRYGGSRLHGRLKRESTISATA